MLRYLSIFKKKIPLYMFLMFIVLNGCVWYIAGPSLFDENDIQNHSYIHPELDQLRETNFKFIRPLLLADINYEDDHLLILKSNVNRYIELMKARGVLSSASVYVRKFKDGGWFTINSDEIYSPGSLLKVGLLISYLKDAEANSALLKKKLFFEDHYTVIVKPNFVDNKLTPGKFYSVEDLLYQMIVHSDNDATVLLMNNLNMATYRKLYSDLNLREPDLNEQDHPMTITEVSKFLRILFNSSYLNKASSESALTLLSKTSFKTGILNSIDKNVPVVHKFGERGVNEEKQLHEIGIIYLENNPYLLGVMTRGNDYETLPSVLSDISALVFDEMKQGN